MKKNSFFLRFNTPPFARRRLWLVGASCLWLGTLCLPALAQNENASPESELLPTAAWAAQWIGRDNPSSPPTLGQQPRAPMLRKEFTLDPSIARATLRICGLGFYEAYLNGRRVGDQVLDPPPTTYNRTALYATFDVSRLVRPGTNAIGVTLGRGYFSGVAQEGFNLGFAPRRNEPRLLLQLDVT
jgi:alpha-L-rhamnosidase